MKQQKGLSAEQNEGKTREDRQTVSQWGKSVESGNREMSMFRGRLAAAKKKGEEERQATTELTSKRILCLCWSRRTGNKAAILTTN
jgi:hypothetical protein